MSRVACLVSYDPRVDPRRDAVAQDVAALRARHAGPVVHFKARAGGWLDAPRLFALTRGSDLIHVFHPSLFAPALFAGLRRPVVFSVAGGIAPSQLARWPRGTDHLARILVSSERDLRSLSEAGFRNAWFIAPGIDLDRFAPSDAPAAVAGGPFRLLCASPPWNARQFALKGIDALLDAAERIPTLHLRFVWRDIVHREMLARVRSRAVGDRVTVFSGYADVARDLREAHAAVVLADQPELVKPYPHSLVEALASARPVIVSRAIALSDRVNAGGFGVVSHAVTSESVTSAIESLMHDYGRFQAACALFPRHEFSRARWLDEHSALYRGILGGGALR